MELSEYEEIMGMAQATARREEAARQQEAMTHDHNSNPLGSSAHPSHIFKDCDPDGKRLNCYADPYVLYTPDTEIDDLVAKEKYHKAFENFTPSSSGLPEDAMKSKYWKIMNTLSKDVEKNKESGIRATLQKETDDWLNGI